MEFLSARLEACADLALSYDITGITSLMVESKYILEECLTAMILKIAELHFERDAFGPFGIEGYLDKFAKPFHLDYMRAMTVESECGVGPCGTMYAVLPHDGYIDFLGRTVEMLVLGILGDGVTPEWRRWRDAWREAY